MNGTNALAGRTALITGAGGGIGSAIAREFAVTGATVLVQDLRLEAATQVANEIEANGGNAKAIDGDISDQADVNRIAATIGETGQHVDILVNNAGLQYVAPVEVFPLEKWNKLLAVMLTGPFLMTRAFLPGMRERGWGRIINISSVNGKRGDPGKSAYCAAKHGLIGLTRTVALETAQDGITVNAICPGLVETDLIHGQLDDLAAVHGVSRDEALEHVFFSRIPQKRFLDAEEIASMARYLASQDARGITGEAINVSAGLVMQ